MTIQQLLDFTITSNASDLHLLGDSYPMVRLNGDLVPVPGSASLTDKELEALIMPLLIPTQREILYSHWELDFGFSFEHKARFRVNYYKQKGSFAAAFRLIPTKIRTIEQTGLPPVVARVIELKQGLVLVAGPTGHGKSSTIASFINQINLTRAEHIITVEDPVEYLYPKGKAIISQREVDYDTKSFTNALKFALREDPDIVVIGELRDLETIAAAMTIAETGHLVFATLHTNSAAQTIDRIIDVFPPSQQAQIRTQASMVLEAVISQRLVPTINPGRALASEVLFTTPALKTLIRESKTHQIDNLIQTSAELGMASLESSLATLVREGKINANLALNYAQRPQLLAKLLGGH